MHTLSDFFIQLSYSPSEKSDMPILDFRHSENLFFLAFSMKFWTAIFFCCLSSGGNGSTYSAQPYLEPLGAL